MLSRITDLFVGGATRYSVKPDRSVRRGHGQASSTAIEAKARAKLSRRLARLPMRRRTSCDCWPSTTTSTWRSRCSSIPSGSTKRDLVANASSKSQQHLAAIAQRKSLSEAVTDVLVERGDRDVVHSVVRNAGARFSDAGFRMLVKRSTGDDALATEVGIAQRHAAAAFPACCWRRPRPPCAPGSPRKIRTAGSRHRRRRRRDRRRHPQRGPQGFVQTSPPRQAAVKRQNRIRPARRGRNLQIRPRDRKFEETAIALSILCDTSIDVVERALLDPRPRNRADPGQGRGLVLDHRQGDPAAAGRRSRHVGAGPRQGADQLRQAAAATPPGACSASSARASRGRRNVDARRAAVAVNG